MNIYEGKVGLGARLGEAFDHYNQRDPDTDYMLVVHTDTPDQSVDDDLPEWNKDFHCKGVLYVRGVRFGGVSSEQRDKVKENYKSGWVHFLSYAVGLNDKLPFPEQFQRFFAEVRERDRIDWSIIEPAWPENLVALYLLSRVLDHLNRTRKTSDRDLLQNQHQKWKPILLAAQTEYKARTEADLGVNKIRYQGTAALAEKLLECLKASSPRTTPLNA